MARVPFIPDKRIARAADALVRACKNQCPEFTLPYSLDVLVWDHLNEMDGLSLDDETPLGSDRETGELILGKTVLDDRIIFIDPDVKSKPYYRFTVAHEIGHWVLHCRPHLPDPNQLSLFEGPAEEDFPREFTTYHRAIVGTRPGLDWEEVQANKFAACLLMPEHEVRREYTARFGAPRGISAGEYDSVSRSMVCQETDNVPSLCAVFGASIESMVIRLKDLGLICEEGNFFA